MIKVYVTAVLLLSLQAVIAHERCLRVKIEDTRNYAFFRLPGKIVPYALWNDLFLLLYQQCTT